MESVQDKHYLLRKKKLLKGSQLFLDEDLTGKQQEERREEVEKVRAARNEGKRAWLYNGKAIIAVFRPHGKTGQQENNKEKTSNSIIGRKTTGSTQMKRGEDSNLSFACQTAQQSNPTQVYLSLVCWNYRGYPSRRGPWIGPIAEGRDIICLTKTHEHDGCKTQII